MAFTSRAHGSRERYRESPSRGSIQGRGDLTDPRERENGKKKNGCATVHAVASTERYHLQRHFLEQPLARRRRAPRRSVYIPIFFPPFFFPSFPSSIERTSGDFEPVALYRLFNQISRYLLIIRAPRRILARREHGPSDFYFTCTLRQTPFNRYIHPPPLQPLQ